MLFDYICRNNRVGQCGRDLLKRVLYGGVVACDGCRFNDKNDNSFQALFRTWLKDKQDSPVHDMRIRPHLSLR